MSISSYPSFDHKENLRKEHQKLLDKEQIQRKQILTQVKSKQDTISAFKKTIGQKEFLRKESEVNIREIQNKRSTYQRYLQQFESQKRQKEQLFAILTQKNKSISEQIKIVQEQLRSLNSKYEPNKSYEVSKTTYSDFKKIDDCDKRSLELYKSLKDVKASIELAAAEVQKVVKQKSNSLKVVNSLVQEEENQLHKIKNINQLINSSKKTVAKLEDEINNLNKTLVDFDKATKQAVIRRQDAISYLPYSEEESIYISPDGLQELMKNFDPRIPEKGIYWSNDYKTELPIFLKNNTRPSLQPQTLIDMWKTVLDIYGNNPALSFEVSENVWKTLTFKEYYAESCRFGKACIAMGLTEYTPIMLMGFNSPEWVFTFYGSIFARYIPVGMYTTNGSETCEYIANHCEGEMVVLEDKIQLQKYYGIIDKCPKIKYFIIYKQNVPANLPNSMKGKVLTWSQFLARGDKFVASNQNQTVEGRQIKQKPGNCATFVYTSGTTGTPKAVMVSHDGYLYLVKSSIQKMSQYNTTLNGTGRLLSYLPLSHAAGQILDIILGVKAGANLFFAHPSALQGTLPKYLLACKPTAFLGVPRVWEKLEQRLSEVIATTTGVKKKLLDWAMSIGAEGTFAQIHGKPTPRGWFIAKKLFDKIKMRLGLEQCQSMVTGAAPMRASTRKFFLQINISFLNGYGMSQTSGPSTLTDPKLWTTFSEDYLNQTGNGLEGCEIYIEGQDKDGKGQICMRGRNRFMGYYKNQEETRKTIDRKGFVHSGDEGRVDKNGTVYITGRIKELIVTAGGENIPPVFIENQIIKECPIVSQVVVIGDYQKYLTCLITLKVKSPTQLAEEVIEIISKAGSTAKSPQEAMTCEKVNAIVKKGIQQANKKAISNAQRVQKHRILPAELTIESGALTPTMKLRRKIIHEMYKAQINSMYVDSKL